jgi:hypothetical protein
MYTEKVQALGEAQTTASIAAIKGGSSHHVAKKVLSVYKKTGSEKPAAAHQVDSSW